VIKYKDLENTRHHFSTSLSHFVSILHWRVGAVCRGQKRMPKGFAGFGVVGETCEAKKLQKN